MKIQTYLGELPVTGVDPRGEWATTGSGWGRRSWAISSTQIEPWHDQVLSAQQTAVIGPAIDQPEPVIKFVIMTSDLVKADDYDPRDEGEEYQPREESEEDPERELDEDEEVEIE